MDGVERCARVNRIRAAMLAHRRCPHCGYDIRLLPTNPADGATVCPECGSAWILPEDSPASPSGDGAPDRTPDP
jgi:predicted Zn-ribbon and HTH transcriptional regulator